jgi:ATP-binding cassette, subfamily B, bacterial MsbA
MGGAVAANLGAALLDIFALTLLIPFLNTLFGLGSPLPTGNGLISRVLNATIGGLMVSGDRLASLQHVIAVVIVAVLLKNVLVWIGGQMGAGLQEYVTRDLRNTVYSHIAHLPIGYFTRTKAGQLLSRVINDTFETRLVITEVITRSLQAAAVVIGSIVLLFALSWQLTLVALIVLPLLSIILQPLLRKLRRGNRTRGAQHGEMTSVLQETIAGMRLVKAFRGEDYEQKRFQDASDAYAKSSVRLTRLTFLAPPITEVVGTVIAMAVLWMGANLVLGNPDGEFKAAQLLTFLVAVMRMLQPLKQLSQAPATAQSSLASAERLFEILDTPAEESRDSGHLTQASFDRELRFENVTFAYDAEPVLQNLNFSVRKGEVIALVGASGAGKSTLVDLIPRFYETTAGRILIDDVDTRDIRLKALRRLTAIVSQDTVLFNDTVRNNIAYADGGRYTDAQIEGAARAANAHGFITDLPEGYQTLLGERGTRLSGGQRQRIAIARALLSDPPILILDEATSALDTESERLVQEALDRLLQGRTVFVIAHRLSTVIHADQILVLDRGEIVERGTHAELLALGGIYHRLHALQFDGVTRRSGSLAPVTEGSTV